MKMINVQCSFYYYMNQNLNKVAMIPYSVKTRNQSICKIPYNVSINSVATMNFVCDVNSVLSLQNKIITSHYNIGSIETTNNVIIRKSDGD